MTVDVLGVVSRRLRPPAMAFLCLAALQFATLAASSCHPEELPMGAVRVRIAG